MKTIQINFKCPTCGENRLAQLRHEVTIMERLESIRIMGKDFPGRKHNTTLEGSRTENEGKVIGFACEYCGYKLTTAKRVDWWERQSKRFKEPKPTPVKTVISLHRWLRERKMLVETEDSE